MVKLLQNQRVFIGFALCALLSLSSGCTGTRKLAFPTGHFHVKGNVSPNSDLSVRVFDPGPNATEAHQELAAFFTERLVAELQKSKTFRNVVQISPEQKPGTDLLLEGEMGTPTERGWGSRALSGAPNKLSFTGRIIELGTGNELVEFQRKRESGGGLVGWGGLLSSGDEALNQKLAEFIANDIYLLLPDS